MVFFSTVYEDLQGGDSYRDTVPCESSNWGARGSFDFS